MFLYVSSSNAYETYVCLQASKLNPKAALPLLGLAQMNLLQKENTNAITLLENALRIHPGWNDALMVSICMETSCFFGVPLLRLQRISGTLAIMPTFAAF